MSNGNLVVFCIVCRKETTISGLSNHFNRIHGEDPVFKTRALETSRSNTEKAKLKAAAKSLEECRRYHSNAKKCACCEQEIDFFRRNNDYCSASCATIFKNIRRLDSSADDASIRNHITNRIEREQTKQLPHCKICFHKCSQCENIILERKTKPGRKTCSRKCQTNASIGSRPYINGRRKNIYYETRTGKTVLLESSWELEIAQYLDEHKINWTRPKYIIWIDASGKQRNYYPDFYLPDYDLYLDPKNPWGMVHDEEKMKYISSKVNILYGDKDMIKSTLSGMLDSNQRYS